MKIFIDDVALTPSDLTRIASELGPDAHVGAPRQSSQGFGWVAHVQEASGPDLPQVDLELVRISQLADKGYRAVQAIPLLIAALREQPVQEKPEESLWTN